MYKRIRICTDGSNNAKKAAEQGIDLAKALDAEVLAINVINDVVIAHACKMGADRKEVEDKLTSAGKKAVGDVKNLGIKVGISIESSIRIGSPAQVIVETSETEKADLIVMGAHGESGASKLLIGSVTQKVLYWSKITVLVVR